MIFFFLFAADLCRCQFKTLRHLIMQYVVHSHRGRAAAQTTSSILQINPDSICLQIVSPKWLLAQAEALQTVSTVVGGVGGSLFVFSFP